MVDCLRRKINCYTCHTNLLVKPKPVSAGEEVMTLREKLVGILEARLGETTGVYVNAEVDAGNTPTQRPIPS